MIPGIMIAAPQSGSGKTLLTCGLLDYLKKQQSEPIAFKCGPDYIDPMFHQTVISVESHNLDSYFLEPEKLRLFFENTCEKSGRELAVVEGVMGLYDGLGGIREEGSAYEIANILDLPILLVINARGMGRSVIPLIAGFLSYDKSHRVQGVILNQTSKMFYETLKAEIEEQLSIPVVGYVPKLSQVTLESRHLGLKLPHETENLRAQLALVSETLGESLDMEQIMAIASGRIRQVAMAKSEERSNRKEQNDRKVGKESGISSGDEPKAQGDKRMPLRLGVARDEAFCFYYEENFKELERMAEKRGQSLELVTFSPLHDTELPERLDGILLGGGYPELVAKELQDNVSMRTSLRQAIEGGIPTVAECGGFMYLHETLVDEKNQTYQMVGALPEECHNTGKLVRFGYVELMAKDNRNHWLHAPIRGHEFHYYDSSDNGNACLASKPVGTRKWECVHMGANHFWGFPHLYYPSNPEFAEAFVKRMEVYRGKLL